MVNIPIHVRRVAVFIGIFVLVFIVLEFNRRLEELTMLNKQNELIRIQATQAVQTQYVLQTAVAYANSTAAVDEWARTDGHYVKDGDLPVVPVGEPGSPPIISSEPTPLPTNPSNWEVWWSLFFGEQ